jgi:hypothetical protein
VLVEASRDAAGGVEQGLGGHGGRGSAPLRPAMTPRCGGSRSRRTQGHGPGVFTADPSLMTCGVSSEAVRPARDGHRRVMRFRGRCRKDVENDLAAPSHGRMRPPWPYNTKETQHDDPADGQRPHRCRRP